MKALLPCSPRIQAEHGPFAVVCHLQDVGVAAHEDIRLETVYKGISPAVVTARIAAYVGHEDLDPLPLEKSVSGVLIQQRPVIYIADHSYQGFEGRDFSGGLQASAEIARMPYFVHGRKKILERGIENPVSI